MPDVTSSDRREAVEIRLQDLRKVYPGTDEPAVEDVTMTIPAGEIAVFVGPSGCGKTTTMRMINRLIEPTSGQVLLDGENVLELDPDELRRRIGYVIQQIGLFPHMTIADNVALVPKMLGWKSDRISDRVDELLEVTGLDPGQFRNRYPKQLSGGQQQRVGVARALAADPPVMLMDEPFGATDPITRERLQNEFLRLQEDLGKTIVFVTHDFDEAIKMGDRIAVLRQRSVIAQYDTPAQILAAPVDDYVESFIGAAPALKRLDLTRLSSLDLRKPWTASRDDEPSTVLQRVGDQEWVLVGDEAGRPQSWLHTDDLRKDGEALRTGGTTVEPLLSGDNTLRDALDALLRAPGDAVVVGRDGRAMGTVGMDLILDAARARSPQAVADAEAEAERR